MLRTQLTFWPLGIPKAPAISFGVSLGRLNATHLVSMLCHRWNVGSLLLQWVQNNPQLRPCPVLSKGICSQNASPRGTEGSQDFKTLPGPAQLSPGVKSRGYQDIKLHILFFYWILWLQSFLPFFPTEGLEARPLDGLNSSFTISPSGGRSVWVTLRVGV